VTYLQSPPSRASGAHLDEPPRVVHVGDATWDIRHTLSMGARLDDYIQEVRERYAEEQRAHLDAEMRRFDLAGQLLSLRLDADVTQQQLAERSGISQADISRYERGLGNPTSATIDMLAVALGAHLELVRNSQPAERAEPVQG
jgi:DNA-binding transcriptional regulator YiaG